LAVVVAKCLFIDIPEQVEGLDTNVGAMQTTLQETPEVLHRVGVDVSVNILYGVVNDGVLIIVFKTVVRFQFIGEDCCPGFDVFAYLLLQFRFATAIDDHCSHVAFSLDHSEYHGLILPAWTGDDALAFSFVHVPGFAADECFIYFDFATEFIEPAFLHRKTNAMEHEPSGLLGNAESTMDFVATDTVLATDNQPRCGKPLLKRDRRIFKDGASLEGEGGPLMSGIAFPYPLFGKPAQPLGATLRTLHDAIRPPQFHHELAAMLEVREPDNRISEGVWRFHVSSMRQTEWNVKYIIAQICSQSLMLTFRKSLSWPVFVTPTLQK
jgi:hypothetical protein